MTSAHALIAASIQSGTAPCITCSFQAEDVVVLHMLLRVRADIPVIFLDTVHHFPEVYDYRDEIARAWRLRLVNVRADEPVPGLWQTGTEACCARHKVGPLFAALAAHDTWFTGLRREQSPTRASLEAIEPFVLPGGKTLNKVSPLARWSTKEVWDYAAAHGIRLLPLYDRGYTSVGCEPCTSLPLDPSNPRSGRWQGQQLECGIHLRTDGAAREAEPLPPPATRTKG